jgi:cytochrome P450
MVLAETLRLYQAVWAIPRGAVADDEIGGYAIPAGSMVFPFTYAAHRHPEVWSEPERFDPGRFAPEASTEHPPCSYLPFGAGSRACIGQTFAVQEAMIVLALVAQRYRLRVAPGQLIVPHSAITLGPRDGLHMTLQRC